MSQHAQEVDSGQRFEFGANWSQFLEELDEDRISRAKESLKDKLETSNLAGLRFLDAGSGSGLFSLAARRLGARVHSFDFDPKSVACTRELRRRYFPDDVDWRVDEASVLDRAYLDTLGRFDIVYSWGVLHHTGSMWEALGNIAPLVDSVGKLFVAIYNDQGKNSRRWTSVKRFYNKSPRAFRPILEGAVCVNMWWRRWAKDAIRLRPFQSWREYRRLRGMSPWRDVVDWVGGYPFEVAKPEEIFDFFRVRGFDLRKLATEGHSSGCNEFVFEKTRA